MITPVKQTAGKAASLATREDVARPPYVFVAGCGHTGTTLMATILGSHSEIHTIPNETAVFCGTDSMAQIHRFLQQSNPHRNHRKAIICEKTPSHVHHIGKIRTYFPDAKIVLMVRDGRDVVASLKHHAGSVTHAINRWVHDTAATLAAAATTNVKMIKYESLVDDPVAVVSEICAFIGVPFQQQMLRFHGDAPDWFGVTERKAGPVAEGGDRRTLRNWQVHQPLFDGRGKWRGQLGGDDLAQFSLAAGALMAELGYEGSANCDIDMACRSDGSGTQPTDGPSPCETGTKPNDEATDETLPDASQAARRLFVEAFEHHREGRLNQAEALYQQVLAIDFRHADSRHLSGVLAYQTGRHDLAVEAIRMAISLNDKIALYHCNLGNALWQLRRLDEAVTCYQSALDLTPHYPEAHNNLGAAFKEQGRLHHAIICYCTAIDLKPDYASAHANLGNAFVELGRLDGAAACYQRVLSLVPDDLGAHLGLANVLREQGRLETAITWYQRALNLKADMPEAHLGLGNALREQGRLEEAIACYRHALDLKPAYPEAHNNLGVTVKQLGRLEEASACYGRALGLGLDIPEAHHNLAIALLTRGDMALGWREYEWRWKTPQMADARRDFAQPQWRGETVEGRTLLIHAEQGYGDTLQFCRYATLAAARGARVIMQVPGPLVRLLGELPGVGLVVEEGQTLPAFDLHCPMLSLPLAMGTTITTIPGAASYLRAGAAEAATWRTRLAAMAIQGPRVGLAWAGNPRAHSPALAAVDRRRSLAPRQLSPLFDLPGPHFFSLQKERPAAPANLRLTDFMHEMEDFHDTAALIANLDLVISVDTAVAHLAAALGKPVWLLNRFDSCWRWLEGRRDSPWYPTLRLYRQPRPGDWGSVLSEVTRDLRDFGNLTGTA